MNARSDFEARLATAFAAYADRAPVEVDPVSLTASIAHRGTRRWWSFPTSRAAWVVVGTVVALLALAVALVVGAFLLRTRPTLGGGGLMVISQAVVPNDSPFTNATSMRVFAFDAATGEHVPIIDWPISIDSTYAPATWAKWSGDRRHALLFDVDGWVRGMVDVASHRLTPWDGKPTADDSTANGDDQFAWDPTGDRIASMVWSEKDLAENILISDVSGREIRRLAVPPDSNARYPAWSPDGSAIVVMGCLPCYAGSKEAPTVIGHEHLIIVPVDGSPVRLLLDAPAEIFDGAVWSPDGSMIAFSTNAGIATVVVANGHETLLSHGHDIEPTWSPDGRRIVFARLGAAGIGSGISVVDVDGTQLTQLTDGPDVRPDWSPDGTSLVFGREGEQVSYPDVWIVGADGGEPRLVVRNATSDW